MPLFHLPASLISGYGDIDRQHAMLFALAERAKASEHTDDRQAVLDLIKYVVEHFSFEYQLMRDVRYPDLEAHHALHQQLTAQVIALKDRVFSDQNIHAELMALMEHWLHHHIETADRQLTDYILAQRG